MSGGLQILIIDDELQIRRLLRITLNGQGYQTHEAADGESGILKAAQIRPDVILLDMGLPDMEGMDVLRRIREWTQTPVIILSVRDDDRTKVAALDAGADDYLTKPFSTDELLARIRVAMRHAAPTDEQPIFKTGDLQVDFTRRLVTVKGEPVKLTPTEYALLRVMIQHAGRVLTHRQILREVWGREYENETHYLRVYFAQLRQKIEPDPTMPSIIVTESGIGYRLRSG